MTLWCRQSFSTRRHGHVGVSSEKPTSGTPQGYDDTRRGASGQIMRVRAQGDKRTAIGYSSPYRCEAEAADLGEQIGRDDNIFPAFRKYTMTGDDYSQWFGLNFKRFT